MSGPVVDGDTTGPGSLSVPSHALDASIFFANNVRVNYPHRYQSDEGASQRRTAMELAEEIDPYLARVRKLSLQRDPREKTHPRKNEKNPISFFYPSFACDEHFVACSVSAEGFRTLREVSTLFENNRERKGRNKSSKSCLEICFGAY